MKAVITVLLAVGAGVVSGNVVLLEPYSQCGGLSYKGPWQCTDGYTCSPIGTDAFPNYQCIPTGTTTSRYAFPYGQCGGSTFTGADRCPPGWTCTFQSDFYSTCVKNPETLAMVDPDPSLAKPGSFCGQTAIARGQVSNCVPGFACAPPGVFGWEVCKISSSPTTTSVDLGYTTLVTSRTATSTLAYTWAAKA